jgi:hypothetical protein
MAEPYNMTIMEGSETLYELVLNANTISGGLTGSLLIFTTFVISFIAFKNNYDGKRAFAGAGFITALVSIFVRVLGLIPDRLMFAAFIIAGIGFVALRWSDG